VGFGRWQACRFVWTRVLISLRIAVLVQLTLIVVGVTSKCVLRDRIVDLILLIVLSGITTNVFLMILVLYTVIA